MPRIIEKVTAFVIRSSAQSEELLLFQHPYAGIQIPAGTVEVGETPEAAAVREAQEETNLQHFTQVHYLGCLEEELSDEQRVLLETVPVHDRPDAQSMSRAQLRKGLTVALQRQSDEFAQVTYQEFDQVPNHQYISLQITGWVLHTSLATHRRRSFYRLEDRSADTRRVDRQYRWPQLDALLGTAG